LEIYQTHDEAVIFDVSKINEESLHSLEINETSVINHFTQFELLFGKQTIRDLEA